MQADSHFEYELYQTLIVYYTFSFRLMLRLV